MPTLYILRQCVKHVEVKMTDQPDEFKRECENGADEFIQNAFYLPKSHDGQLEKECFTAGARWGYEKCRWDFPEHDTFLRELTAARADAERWRLNWLAKSEMCVELAAALNGYHGHGIAEDGPKNWEEATELIVQALAKYKECIKLQKKTGSKDPA